MVFALQAYAIAKVLSEKEASKLAEENGISLVAVCPVATVGASPAPVANESVANVLSLLSGEYVSTGSIVWRSWMETLSLRTKNGTVH